MKEQEKVNAMPALFRDLGKALGIGLTAAAAGFILLFMGGFLFGDSQTTGRVLAGLEAAKDGLLFLGALGLFLLAGMILMKGKKTEKPAEKNSWNRHFQVAGYKTVLAILCVCQLLLASAADYVLLKNS